MNSAEAATILAIFHGAYPNVKLDEAVAGVWENSLALDKFHIARLAANEWVSLQQWWPTPAEFRQKMRRVQEVNYPKTALPGSKVATMEEAMTAFSAGYRHSRVRAGDTDEQMQEKLDVLLRSWPGSIAGVG